MQIDDVENINGWTITLTSGAALELFADSYSEQQGYHSFGLIVRATDEEQAFLRVDGRNMRNQSQVILEVLRIPSEEIASIDSGLP